MLAGLTTGHFVIGALGMLALYALQSFGVIGAPKGSTPAPTPSPAPAAGGSLLGPIASQVLQAIEAEALNYIKTHAVNSILPAALSRVALPATPPKTA